MPSISAVAYAGGTFMRSSGQPQSTNVTMPSAYSADRYLIGIAYRRGNAGAISATVDGVAVSVLASYVDATNGSWLVFRAQPTGTPAAVAWTTASAPSLETGCAAWEVFADSPPVLVASANGTSGAGASAASTSGGFGFGVSLQSSATTPSTVGLVATARGSGAGWFTFSAELFPTTGANVGITPVNTAAYAATVGFPPPAFTGTAASPLGALSGAASGAVAVPAFTGAATSPLGSISSAAAGTRTVPAFTGTASSALAPLGQSAAGTRTVPAFTGTATSGLAPLGQAGAGTRTVPAFTGTATSGLGPLSSAAAGTSAAAVTGTAASTLGALTSAASGTVTSPVALGWGEDFASGVSPFTSGVQTYDDASTGELVHNADASLAHRVRYRTAEAFPLGAKVSTRVYLEPGVTRLVGIAFLNPASAGQYLTVMVDNRNGGTGSSTASLQIREAVATNGSGIGGLALAASTWYRLTAWIDPTTGLVTAEVRSDAGVLLGTTSRAPLTYDPLTWGGVFWAGVHGYGFVRNDDYRVGAFDSTATSTLGPLSSTGSGSTGPRGPATSTLGPLKVTAAGTRTVPAFTGTATSTLGSLGQAAAGTRTIPVRTGTATSALGSLTTAGVGSIAPPPIFGTATSTLAGITSLADAFFDPLVIIPPILTLRTAVAENYRLVAQTRGPSAPAPAAGGSYTLNVKTRAET